MKFDGYILDDNPESYVAQPHKEPELDVHEAMSEHSEPTPVLKVEVPSHVTYYELTRAPQSRYALRHRKPRVHKPETKLYVPYDIQGKVLKIVPHRLPHEEFYRREDLVAQHGEVEYYLTPDEASERAPSEVSRMNPEDTSDYVSTLSNPCTYVPVETDPLMLNQYRRGWFTEKMCLPSYMCLSPVEGD